MTAKRNDYTMEKIVINGAKPLNGEIEIGGMKNGALPIIFASILVADGICMLENLPAVKDIDLSLEIIESLGAKVERIDRHTARIDASAVKVAEPPASLVRKMRASYYLLGAELGRFGEAVVQYPGGCDFGGRPIDRHIKGFETLGAKVTETFSESGKCVRAHTEDGVVGANVFFDDVSVGATINVMLASVTAKGLTIIENAAREPHIVDLANFLNTCGARVMGAGTPTIKITGVDKSELHGCTYTVVPDMIEAGTYMVAAAATGGRVLIKNVIPKHLEATSTKLAEMGVKIVENDDSVEVSVPDGLTATNIKTLPYPGIPTDMQPQFCVLMCVAKGTSKLVEGVFDNRFQYVGQLRNMGASIEVNGRVATISGGSPLYGAPVSALDLRAGAAMVIAGLAAQGKTEIENINYINRGYEDIVEKLSALGADISLVNVDD